MTSSLRIYNIIADLQKMKVTYFVVLKEEQMDTLEGKLTDSQIHEIKRLQKKSDEIESRLGSELAEVETELHKKAKKWGVSDLI